MDEMDSSSTTRLRRRSFFENIESDPSAFAPPSDTVSSNESNKDPSSAIPAGVSSTSSGGNGTSAAAGANDDDESRTTEQLVGVPVLSHARGHGYRGGVLGALAHWFLAVIWSVLQRIKVWLLSRWQRLRLHEQPPFRYIKMLREKTEAAAAVKHWAYPTHWITFGCISLVMLQVVIYWYFQLHHLDLNVKECVFHEQLMPSVNTKDMTVPSSSGAALRYLERRFEQHHSHGPGGLAQKNKPRLPWTCISIVSTGGKEEMTQANDMAFLLPRSHILQPSTAGTVASRFQLAVGSSPLDRTEHAGVLGALFPLSSFRKDLFPHGFPDLVLVKSEYALSKMIKYRQEQQEELHHNVQRAIGNADDPAHHGLSSSQFGIFLMKTTVPDIYNRLLLKNWDAFLHVVVVSKQDKKEQFTKELLSTWLQHPEWPTLYVRFENSVALCGSYVRYMSSIRSDAADHHKEEGANEDEEYRMPSNIDISCDEKDSNRTAIIDLKNQIGMHLFPSPPETEELEEAALESLAVGAMVISYNTPIMQEWIPDSCGLRVGTFELPPPRSDAEKTLEGAFALPVVQVTASEIERAVEGFLGLDRVNRVAMGRASRLHYLRMRTHYLSAAAALDTAVCDDDNDESIETQSEIGQRSRKKVEVETLRVFLY